MSRTAPRVDILGIEVSVVSMDEAVGRIREMIRTDSRGYICVSDMNALLSASQDRGLRDIHNRSALTLPDGTPLALCGRLAGARAMVRVPGPDLLPRVLLEAASHGWRSYFYGGAQGIPETLVEQLSARLGSFKVAGTMSPPFRPLSQQEDDAVVAEINHCRPDIVWVGLGAPKQEQWMAEHRDALAAPVLIGVGAAFDMHAGSLQRAPLWMRRAGLEWAYRLWREPRRLWRRYVIGIPTFVLGIARRRPRLALE